MCEICQYPEHGAYPEDDDDDYPFDSKWMDNGDILEIASDGGWILQHGGRILAEGLNIQKILMEAENGKFRWSDGSNERWEEDGGHS